jgi:Na+-driven multidrug efflux pump
MLAISHTAAVFVSQNSGALKYKRIKRSIIYCCLTVSVVGLTFATIMYLFSDPLIAMLGAKSAETIEIIKLRLVLLGFTYFMCGVMDTLANSLRSLGKSVTAMVISLFFCCGVRLLWLATVVKYLWNSVTGIYFVYPLTWLLAVLTYITILIPLLKKQQKQHGNE